MTDQSETAAIAGSDGGVVGAEGAATGEIDQTVLVIGGGLAGLGVATGLAVHKVKVTVLELSEPKDTDQRFDPKVGASYKNAGMLDLPHPFQNHLTKRWENETLRAYEDAGVPINRKGLSIASETIREGAQVGLIDGNIVLNKSAFKETEPNLNYAKIKTISYHPESRQADPQETMRILQHTAVAQGVQFRYGERIVEISFDSKNGEFRVVTEKDNPSRKETYLARRIVVAAGPNSKDLMRECFQMELPLYKVLGIMMMSSLVKPSEGVNGLVTGSQSVLDWTYASFRHRLGFGDGREITETVGARRSRTVHLYAQTTDNRFIIGGPRIELSDQYRVEDLNPDHYRKAMDRTIRYAKTLIKIPPTMKIERTWSGVMAFSDDDMPLVGPVVQVPGLYLNTGFASAGFRQAYGAGLWLAGLMVNGCSTEEGSEAVLPGSRVKATKNKSRGCLVW